jgi:AcrR family transcriptional regulator
MKPAHRRRQILQTARELFAARGYHDTSVSDIVLDAGIARGTFYLYFDGKRALFDELIDQFIVAIENCVRLVEMKEEAPPPYEQLKGNVSRVLALLTEEREMASILINHAVGLDQESDEKLHAFYDKVIHALVIALEAGGRMGLATVGDAEITARFILGGIKEVVHFIVVRGGEPRDHGRLVTHVLSIALGGVASGPLSSPEIARSTRALEGEESGHHQRADGRTDRDGDTSEAGRGAGATVS